MKNTASICFNDFISKLVSFNPLLISTKDLSPMEEAHRTTNNHFPQFDPISRHCDVTKNEITFNSHTYDSVTCEP